MRKNHQVNYLKSYIKHVLLQERVFGAQAIVYHGSKTPPNVMIPILLKDEFVAGGEQGAMYGPGLYTVYDEDYSTRTFNGSYGDYVYKLKVNLYGFIIFDPDICKKVYGKKMSPMEQLEMLGHDDVISEIEKRYESGASDEKSISGMRRGEAEKKVSVVDKVKSLFGRVASTVKPAAAYPEDKEEWFLDPYSDRMVQKKKRKQINPMGPDVAQDFSSQDAILVSKILSEKVKGIVFTGKQDGKVAVIYDPSSVVPVAWSMTLEAIRDHGLYRDVYRPNSTGQLYTDITWQPIDKTSLKPAISRSAEGQFTPGRYSK